MEPRTVVIYSTPNATYITDKASYKPSKSHKCCFEVDLPLGFQIAMDGKTKKKLKNYITDSTAVEQFIVHEMELIVDAVKKSS